MLRTDVPACVCNICTLYCPLVVAAETCATTFRRDEPVAEQMDDSETSDGLLVTAKSTADTSLGDDLDGDE